MLCRDCPGARKIGGGIWRSQFLWRNLSKKSRNGNSKKPLKQKNVAAVIMSHMNYYFGLENLHKDKFMLGHLSKNEGWIEGSVFCEEFPKIRALRVNPATLAIAVQGSKLVETGVSKGEICFRPRGIKIASMEDVQMYAAAGFSAERDCALVPKYKHNSEINLISSKRKIQHVMTEILANALKANESFNYYPIALDVEYATVHQGGPRLPALISICTPERSDDGKGRRVTWLLWLDKMDNRGLNLKNIPPALLNFLSDSRILKIGSSVQWDATALGDSWGSITPSSQDSNVVLSMKGLLELKHLIKDKAHEKDGFSLEALSINVLNKKLVKKKATRDNSKQSHWRAAKMTDQMRTYAADDVAVTLDIYDKLVENISKEDFEDLVSQYARTVDVHDDGPPLPPHSSSVCEP